MHSYIVSIKAKANLFKQRGMQIHVPLPIRPVALATSFDFATTPIPLGVTVHDIDSNGCSKANQKGGKWENA